MYNDADDGSDSSDEASRITASTGGGGGGGGGGDSFVLEVQRHASPARPLATTHVSTASRGGSGSSGGGSSHTSRSAASERQSLSAAMQISPLRYGLSASSGGDTSRGRIVEYVGLCVAACGHVSAANT